MDTTSPQSDSAISAKGQAIPLFPTVCFVVEHENTENLNQELKAYCLEQEKSAEGMDLSNKGEEVHEPVEEKDEE